VFHVFVEIGVRAATVVFSSASFPCAPMSVGEGTAVDARRSAFPAFLFFAVLGVYDFRTFVGEKLHCNPRF
jgi:hypothetical protein